MPIPTFRGQEEPQALGPRQGGSSSHGSAQPAHNQSGDAQPAGAGVNTGAGTTREKTDEEREADRKYEEAMEDEYAKREGGA